MSQEAPSKPKRFSIIKLITLVAAVWAAYIFFLPFYVSLTLKSHQFSFGGPNENEGIVILDYNYNKRDPIAPADWQLKEGLVPQGGGSYDTFDPPGDRLYVKWKVLATGKEYEDTVDLKDRLPKDMNRKRIHFIIVGEKLNVYVVSKRGHGIGNPECPVRIYRDYGCDRIYPDYWKNYNSN